MSPAAQRNQINRWTEERGYVLAFFTEDLSRSGKFSPFKRPEAGPPLTDPMTMGAWDIVVTTKIDRLCRNTKDFLTVMDWCKDNGKQYVSLKEQIDMTTAQGRENARQAASRAEWERDMASERRLETLDELRTEGRWAGGRIPYGLRADERTDGFFLVPDVGGTAGIANKMAAMSIAGESNAAIQRWLNAEGFPNAAGLPWTVLRVRQVLHSDSIGLVLGEEKHAQLKLALHSRRREGSQWTSGRHILLRVAFCANCEQPLYAEKVATRTAAYYRCNRCGFRLPYTNLEDKTIGSLMFVAGDEQVHRKVVHMCDQHTAERFDLLREIDTLRAIQNIDVSAAIAGLETKLKALTDSIEPGTETWEPTGQTVEELWGTLDRAGQGQFLRDAKVRVDASPGRFKFNITEAGIIQVTHSAA